ncbi:GNAT family N-acetyltransferase [Endozoicomonas arenosclerae]|uniref:GNAT family N-acetyltransferase n=1 Tax=Endozoicomonas arenosclerae TaxID=1633495 RepID=UPI0007839B0B|nr:N-acetyltransferase [Endozoicomonas arenosclerae]
MNLSIFEQAQSQAVIELFKQVFSDSEGKDEGETIGALVSEMIETTDAKDLIGFVVSDDDHLTGAIFFSRFSLESDTGAFILSPVAVSTDQQGKGIGQKLIRFGLNHLRENGVELALTYGDPGYYSKVGFQAISEETIKAPQKLSHPHGWLAQSLTGDTIPPISGETRCVEALNKPVYW